MHYPGSIKKEYKKNANYANRGMDLESELNISNEYYLNNNRALIYKKPTPIGIVSVDYKQAIITKAYFKTPSTLDYNGLYKGKYIEFEAKESLSKTSFPLNNFHEHQIIHIKKAIQHGGIVFIIIRMNGNTYLLKGSDFQNYLEKNKRKSIPYTYIEEKGKIIKDGITPRLDYLSIVDEIYFKEEENGK